MQPRLRARAAGICAAVYGALLPFALLTLRKDDRSFALVVSVYIGAALVVAMFATLADVRLLPRMATTVGLIIYLLILLLVAFRATEIRLNDDDIFLFVWFWFATICMTVGLVLPIRLYAGSVGSPRARQTAKPSVAGLLGIIAYFGLVPLPLSVAIPDGGGIGTFVMAPCMTAVCAGPALVLMCSKTWVRILAAIGGFLTYIMWGMAAGDDPSMAETAPAVFTPLAASILAWWSGLRLRR